MIDYMSIPITRVRQSRLPEVDFENLGFGRVFSDHMFVARYEDGQWQQARIQPFEKIQVSPAMSTIHYGQSVFEGLKAYRNTHGEVTLFRPEANHERINRSAERLCMPTLPEEVFMGGMRQLLQVDQDWVPQHPTRALYIRPFLFATDDFLGIRASDTYSFLIITCLVGTYYNKPVRVKIETHYNRAFPGGTGFAKAAGNYASSLYPAYLARQQGYDQLIWTDGRDHRYIEEAGTMNVMFVIDDTLVTPATNDSILPGITRDSILTLARDLGIPTEARRVSVEELIKAVEQGRLREAFGTGTAATIAPIASISYEGFDYELPPIPEDGIGPRLLRALNDIRLGRTADPYGWVMPLEVSSPSKRVL